MIKNSYIEPSEEHFAELCKRPKKNESDLAELISDVFRKVENDGDIALIKFTEQFDMVKLSGLMVEPLEIERAVNTVSNSLKRAIIIAKENITKFHSVQVASDIIVETTQGVTCKQKSIGIERVGIYIPGGTAPLFSTVLMLAIPANLAGCKEIVLCSPPDRSGDIHPAILFAADLCGVSKIFKVGGAQAIAAMTIGTESIPSVSKVFGPGNQYVTAAKQYAQKYGVSMDSPAGPSELLVFANETAISEFVAADLLSQAEHGIDSQVILVATSKDIVTKVNLEIVSQIEKLPRRDIAQLALANSKAIVLKDKNIAFDFINRYGPEHLIIAAENFEDYIDDVINAGSVFLGNYCPESAGDYASGTNHTLPTDGWAKSYSGVNVDSFCRKITFQEITKQGIQNLGGTIIEMAENESLRAHANAVKVRLDALIKVEL